MSKNVRKVPLNLKLLQKSQDNNGKATNQDNYLSLSQNASESLQDNQQQGQVEYVDDDSPFLLKCKENTDVQANDIGKNRGQSQSQFFPSSVRQVASSTNIQYSSTGNNSNSNNSNNNNESNNNSNQPKQRFVRRYLQQNQASPQLQQSITTKHFTTIETNKEKINYQQQIMFKTFSNQQSIHMNSSQKEKNPFSNNVISNIVEISCQKSNKKQKQMEVQKFNPAYKLDEQFIKTMNQFRKQNAKNDGGVTQCYKSQESLDGQSHVVNVAKHLHRNFKIVSKTHNDLDNQEQNGFQDKHKQDLSNWNKNSQLISEGEKANLIKFYHQNVQNTMTDDYPSNNESPQNYTLSQFNDPPQPQRLKQSELIKFQNGNQKQQDNSENTQCSTPPQKVTFSPYIDQQEQVPQGSQSVRVKSNSIKRGDLAEQSNKDKDREIVKPNFIKQNQIQFTNVNGIKNSSSEYQNIFKGGSQNYIPSQSSFKDLDEKQINQTPFKIIRKSFKNEMTNNQDQAQQLKLKNVNPPNNINNKKELFFCSFQNIEKINLDDEDQDDFELYNHLSCNMIPDNGIDSHYNLDQAYADIQQKNFIMRKIKIQNDAVTSSARKQQQYSNIHFIKRSSSSSGKGSADITTAFQNIQREPVK